MAVSYPDVADHHVFHFQDGRKAHNLKDLRDAIATMAPDVFGHHVDEGNNDFANWVEFVYKNPDFATKLHGATTPEKTLEVIDEELSLLVKESKADEAVEDELPKPLEHQKQESEETVSTVAPRTFIPKDFLWGVAAGVLLGLIIMAILLRQGVLG